ncbi:hypothetical protein [Actinoplanes subtropicus]|uniref:hypothetical protein n=1 Tax=Actinoplanes subtropicus TaxID=543632 RepID=UPI0012FBB0BD|nr:hypothetical protein [Actinoplanes subtropicus]
MALAGTGRTRSVLRWPAGFVALVVVCAAAGSAPTRAFPGDDAALYAQCRRTAQAAADKYRGAGQVTVAVRCERPDGTVVDPKLWSPAAPTRPVPVPVMTVGHAGCVTGPGRPVVRTALTSVSAKATAGEAVIYQYQRLDGSGTTGSSGSPVLEFGPGDLAPGGSYRWRARVDDLAELAGGRTLFADPDEELRWSSWCEFTVSADAVDYRGLGDVSLAALTELGLRPDRDYTVRLSSRQQRLLRAGTNIGRTSDRMTLTGPRWTDLLVQLTESASIADDAAAEAGEDDPSVPDGTAARRLVDAISVELGGPHHPHLG